MMNYNKKDMSRKWVFFF